MKRIKEEKEQLIAQNIIKKEKALPIITEDEIPFEIPSSWEWVRLNHLCKIIGDGLHGTPTYDENGDYYFVNGSNLKENKVQILENTKRINKETYESNKKLLDSSTI